MKLLKRSVIIARHFFFDDAFGNNIKKHQQLTTTLKSFVAHKFISPKTLLIYLRKYISNAFPVSKSLDILNHHYSFLETNFSVDELRMIFNEGLVCYAEENYKIVLSGSKENEREGSLSLYFLDNGVNISQLSFTVSNGKAFDTDDKNMVVISRFQQIYAHVDKVRAAKKYFHDIMPTAILFNVLEAICVGFGIKTVIGIHGKDQLSYDDAYHSSYAANYDEFWMHNGGTISQYGYVMNCPFPQKDLLEVKQTHRNRARRKRERLDGIYNNCYNAITKIVSAACTLLITVGFDTIPELALELIAV